MNTTIRTLAKEHGIDLAGVCRVEQLMGGPDVPFYHSWLAQGMQASMSYLEGERAAIRGELDRLLPGARSVICLAVNYNSALPYSNECADPLHGWIARYAWGEDYHEHFRARIERFVDALQHHENFTATANGDALPHGRASVAQFRICVDTSPVLERALARHAGIGWLAKNTCIINQELGSWLFLGEVLTTLELDPGTPAADRCGTCTACIAACPTQAIIEPRVLDSRRCISYWTIEERGAIPEEMRPGIGRHVFGCDICQDVCPWNRKAPVTADAAFQARDGLFNPPLARLSRITEPEFLEMFRHSPVRRAKYRGFLRNICVAIGNSGDASLAPEVKRLANHSDPLIAEHARWALKLLNPSGQEASTLHA